MLYFGSTCLSFHTCFHISENIPWRCSKKYDRWCASTSCPVSSNKNEKRKIKQKIIENVHRQFSAVHSSRYTELFTYWILVRFMLLLLLLLAAMFSNRLCIIFFYWYLCRPCLAVTLFFSLFRNSIDENMCIVFILIHVAGRTQHTPTVSNMKYEWVVGARSFIRW